MNVIKWILSKVDGKKATIVALITTTTAFLVSKSVIEVDTGVYIDSMITILAFGANYANAKIRKQ